MRRHATACDGLWQRVAQFVERIHRVNIVVCMKETPSITAVKRFTADMRLERRKEDAEINPFDEYALEEGLRQREKHGGEVIALCMGPATATENIRKALAIGADRGVLVTDPALEGSDAIGTARALAAALQKLGFDLALFGSAAADSYGGVVPAAVAEFLGQPLLSFASKLEIADGRARIERAAETGYQVAEAAIPALVSVIQTINVPRYPSMKGIMQSKKKPIDTFSLADLGLDAALVGGAGAREKATGSSPVDTQRKGEMYSGNDGAADRIVAFLVEQKVL
jgi:electron transfer flavoprotein beta subunit